MGRRNRAERVEIVRRARARGMSYHDIERVTGITKPDRYITNDEQESA